MSEIIDDRPEGAKIRERAPWKYEGSLPHGCVSAAAARIKDGRVAVVGGFDATGIGLTSLRKSKN